MQKIVFNDLFHLSKNAGIVSVKFNPKFRNKQWAMHFGYIQNLLKQGNTYDQITFDFSDCIWMDPIPLLSFILSVKSHILNYALSPVIIKIPNDDSYSKSSHKKLLKFLAIEGFLKEFVEISKRVYNENYEINYEKIDYLSHLNTQMRYNNSSVLPCMVLNLKEYKQNDDLFEKELIDFTDKVKVNLLGKDSESIIDEIIYKVKIILDETLQNIKTHAYDPEENLFAGFYIRYRYGLTNKSIGSDGKSDLEKAIVEEEINCPMLDKSFVESHFYFLEVFVIDNGFGIKDTLDHGIKNFAFRDSIIDIMLHGRRGKKSSNKNLTEKGGLSLIYNLLNADKDYLCGLSNGQWIGEYVPFLTRHAYLSAATDVEVDKTIYPDVSGLSWLFRLSINTNRNLDESIWSSFHKTKTAKDLFEQAYSSLPENQYSLLSIPFRDYRFDVESNSAKQFEEVRIKYKVKINEKTFLVFPMKGQTKTGIWNLLDKALEDSKPLEGLAKRILIIADISDDQALVYIASLANVVIYHNDTWKTKVSDIILATRTMHICYLRKKFNDNIKNKKNPETLFTFEINSELGDNYIECSKKDNDIIDPGASLVELIQFIRFYDSQLFWNYLFEQKNNHRYFINNNNILWTNTTKKLDGYLNFSHTLNDPLLNDIYRISLERCKCLFSNGNCEFEYLDELTKTIIQRIPVTSPYNSNSKHPKIYVGSVFVSDSNSDDDLIPASKQNSDIVIYFFIHRNARSEDKILSLLYWPSDEVIQKKFIKNNSQYQRVGRTFAIAKHGSKYFTIPRYEKNNEEYLSFYLRSPKDTYRDWQSIQTPIVAFGNYSYEGLNDLITIDIKKAVEHSFKYKTDLSKFLVADFMFALLGPRVKKNIDSYIYPEYSEYKDLIVSLASSDIRRTEFYENAVDLIVYPDHSDTGLIIQNLKKIISDSDLKDKLVPLKFIKSNNVTNSLLVSPLTLEHIEDSLEKSKNKNPIVLIFDSVLVSGKTRKQIKHTLFGFGINIIKTLVVLDRSRLPISLPSERNLRSYWRFDVPTFGTRGPNIISRTLNEINSSKDILVDSVGVRLEDWEKAWGEVQILLRRHWNGLNATNIKKKSSQGLRKYKYGISRTPPHSQLGGDQNCVELSNSHGIIIFLCEMRIMTGRDDLLMRFLNDSELSNTIKIEIICSQLLLFPGELPKEILYVILERLFILIYSRKDYDNHTSLAALTLCAQKKNVIENLFERIKSQKIERVYKVNLDVQIALAFLSNKYKIKSLEFTHYNQLLIKRKDDNLLTIYKRLHFEIFQEKGKLHSKPLLTLIGSSPYEVRDKVRQVLNSLYRLKNIFNIDIRSEYFNTSEIFEISIDDLLREISVCQFICEELLKEKKVDISSKREFSQLLNNVSDKLLPELFQVHKTIFALINSEIPGERPFEKRVRLIIKEITQEGYRESWMKDAIAKGIKRPTTNIIPEILFSNSKNNFPEGYSNYGKIFIPYDHYVLSEIKDILYNSISSFCPISDPWDSYASARAEMWVKIDYEDNYCKLLFVNSIDSDYTEVSKKVLTKIKLEREHLLKKLNCKFETTNLDQNGVSLLSVNLSIPLVY